MIILATERDYKLWATLKKCLKKYPYLIFTEVGNGFISVDAYYSYIMLDEEPSSEEVFKIIIGYSSNWWAITRKIELIYSKLEEEKRIILCKKLNLNPNSSLEEQLNCEEIMLDYDFIHKVYLLIKSISAHHFKNFKQFSVLNNLLYFHSFSDLIDSMSWSMDIEIALKILNRQKNKLIELFNIIKSSKDNKYEIQEIKSKIAVIDAGIADFYYSWNRIKTPANILDFSKYTPI